MRQDSVSKDSASIANRVFKKLWAKLQNDYVITPSEVLHNARFICQVWKSHKHAMEQFN